MSHNYGSKHDMDLVERQAEPFCGCGDQIVPDTGARCGTCASLRDDEIERLRMLLAESQAREAKLRAICARAHDRLLRGDDDSELLLILERGWKEPADDTALREMIAAARTEEREMCANRARAYAYMSPNFDVLADELLAMRSE